MKSKKSFILVLFILGMIFLTSPVFGQSRVAYFSNFIYEGKDRVYEEYPLEKDEYYNPILQGTYPDPSITRKGEDYYLVNSSFSMFPGVPVFHSKDLVNWTLLGHVLDRPSQLKVATAGVSDGIYAPDIQYNPHNDTFYMVTTQIASGIGNMVVKSKDPAKGWSEVKKLNFDGIDPALFFDQDGKAYLVHNDAPPKGTELYEGHRVIKIWDYDLDKDQVVEGSDRIIVNGGVDLSRNPIWIEGPHIYKNKGKYYLMCAEGGTGGNHSEVIFSSDSVKGPYVPAKNNPILTQRYFTSVRKNKVDWAGHADLVQDGEGNWYGVFLGIRPNEKQRVNTGRETFILPVDWSGEFPVFENGLVPINPKNKLPKGVENNTGKPGFFPNGNFTFKDSFQDSKLDPRWIAMRGPREKFTKVGKEGLEVISFKENIHAKAPVSALFFRQQHSSFQSTVTLNYEPKNETDFAGITCYQNEKSNYVFGVTSKKGKRYLVLERTEKAGSRVIAQQMIPSKTTLHLQVTAAGDEYKFNYSIDGKKFLNLGGAVSGDILSTDVAGGFTGALIGLYHSSGSDITILE